MELIMNNFCSVSISQLWMNTKWLKLLLDINQSQSLSKSFLISCTTRMASTLLPTARYLILSLPVHGFLTWFLEWSRRRQPRCFGSRLWWRKRQKILGRQKLMVRYLGTSRIFENRKRRQHVRSCSMHIFCSYSTRLWVISCPGFPGHLFRAKTVLTTLIWGPLWTFQKC